MVNVVLEAHCPVVGVKVQVVVVVLFNAGDHVPVIPLFEVVGNADNVSPLHIGATAVNVGVVPGVTVMVNVVVDAHCPEVGVKVQVVVAVLFKAGDQLPVTPLVDVVGRAASVCPLQMGATAAKAGVTFGFTTTVMVAFEAHCAGFGVKVQVVVTVLFIAGDHVPTFPLLEVVGNVKV